MSNYYNLDGIRTALKKELAQHENYLAWWQAVTYPTKKDGKPFAIMSKNIDGASYRNKEYALQSDEKVLKVGGWIDGIGYSSDELDCYELVRYLKDEKKKAKTQNYLPKQTYLEQVYNYDLEDIKDAVSNRIKYHEKQVKVLKNQLSLLDNAFNKFKTAYGNALKELEKNTLKAENSTMYYMILDTVKDRYPYC